MKKIILIGLLIMLILLFGCSVPKDADNSTNSTYSFEGEPVTFQLASTNISLNDSIILESSNYTGEINVYTFCDVPFNLLMKKGVPWKYVFPDYLECSEPVSKIFEPGTKIPIQKLPLRRGNSIEKGTYMVKIYYSTYAP